MHRWIQSRIQKKLSRDDKFRDCVMSKSFLPIPAVCKLVWRFVEFRTPALARYNSKYVTENYSNNSKSKFLGPQLYCKL